MFNGIVEAVGTVTSIIEKNSTKIFCIAHQKDFSDVHIGDSIAINGVCLTVTELAETYFQVCAVAETLKKTNLNDLVVSQPVNIERALKQGARVNGHYVQGHIDATGEITSIQHQGEALYVAIHTTPILMHYLIEKGYVALDGMSITLIEVKNDYFTVTFIPHTQQHSIIPHYRIGSRINIEVDLMGKYIEKLLGAYPHANPI